MSEKGLDNTLGEEKEEKIVFSLDKIICFACGEQIDKETKVCPYCKTSIN
jgi:hypothetical protein